MTSGKILALPDNLKDLYFFEEIVSMQQRIFSEKITHLDLSALSFIEPYSMLGLIILGKKYLRNTGERLGLVNIPLSIHQYLYRMDFFKAGIFQIGDTLDEKYFLKRSSFSNRVIEITYLPNKERESIKVISDVITIFRKRASQILKYWLNSSIIDYFVTVISEICQNVYEHSLDSGYLAMQTYSYGNEHVVRLVISDSGIGIRRSFEGKDIRFESNAHLIKEALTSPISSKRQFGHGLCQVNSIVERLRGNIFIRSENASVAMMYKKKTGSGVNSFLKNDLTDFPGTQISISLSG